MSLYRIVKAGYKRFVPKAARNTIYTAMPTFLKVLRAKVIRLLEKSAHHDEIYDKEYYTAIVDPYMLRSCDTIVKSIVNAFYPKSAVDIGCGTGLLLLALQKHGVCCCRLEYSEEALDICRQRGLDVTKFDLEHNSLPSDCKADIAISTEVAEHLPASCADRFVDTLCSIADNIVLTAAEPQASHVGTDHVNEQYNKYWIEKFETRCFEYDKELSNQWRHHWKAHNISPCYLSLMVFCKKKENLAGSSGERT